MRDHFYFFMNNYNLIIYVKSILIFLNQPCVKEISCIDIKGLHDLTCLFNLDLLISIECYFGTMVYVISSEYVNVVKLTNLYNLGLILYRVKPLSCLSTYVDNNLVFGYVSYIVKLYSLIFKTKSKSL